MERFLSDGLERIIGKKSWENEKKAQALLISILLNGYIYNGNKNDKNTHNMNC